MERRWKPPIVALAEADENGYYVLFLEVTVGEAYIMF